MELALILLPLSFFTLIGLWARFCHLMVSGMGWQRIYKCNNCDYTTPWNHRINPCQKCGSTEYGHSKSVIARPYFFGGWEVKDESTKTD